MNSARGRKRIIIGLILQSAAILVYLFFIAFVLEDLTGLEPVLVFALGVLPIVWWIYSLVTCVVVCLRKPWAPKLALVRAITTLVAFIWLGCGSFETT